MDARSEAPLSSTRPPISGRAVVAIDMGYGHLRPARTLARALGTSVLHADRAPLADEDERQRCATTRIVDESMTRVSGIAWWVNRSGLS
jgi:hypothetical protein